MIEGISNIDKFAFVGAQSVGKTTMTEVFKDKFANNRSVTVIEEGARVFFDSHPHTIGRSVMVQEQIQNFVLARERAAYRPETKLIIADRSVIDPIILTGIWNDPEGAARLLENVAGWLPTYTSLILLHPSGVPSSPDQHRKETPQERLAIHDAFGEFCVNKGVPIIEVSGSIQERVKIIEHVIYQNAKDKTIFE